MNDIHLVVIVAIAGLSGLGSAALYKGINGKLLTTICSAIVGVVGFCFGQAV